MVIRPAVESDAVAIAALLPDLGYSATAERVSSRLVRLVEWPDSSVLVATVASDLVALCQVQGVPLVASDGYAEVQALVVASQSQRQGIGRELLKAVGEWAAQRGYTRIRLRSGVHREEAHVFYEAQGFIRSKPSYAFERAVPLRSDA